MKSHRMMVCLLLWEIITVSAPNGVAQATRLTSSDEPNLNSVIGALGGKERILGIQSCRASLIYHNNVFLRAIRPSEIEKTQRNYKKERDRAERQAAKKGEQELDKIKNLPLPDPTLVHTIHEQQHQQFQVELPSKARNIILQLGTPIKREGDDVGLDIIDRDGVNQTLIRSGNDLERQKEQLAKQADLSYSLPLLGMMQVILRDGKFTAEFKGSETVDGTTIHLFLLNVEQASYKGQWNLRVNGSTHLPISLEYQDGYPPVFLNAQDTIFAASVQKSKSATRDRPEGYWPKIPQPMDFEFGKPEVGKALSRYKQRIKFIQSFGAYRESQGIQYPALVKTTIVLPKKKYDWEWHLLFTFMSLEWNPKGPPSSMRGDLEKLVTQRQVPQETLTSGAAARESERVLPSLRSIQRLYKQLVWSAVFTFNQYHGRKIRSPRYLVISPDWARFYGLPVVFPQKRPLDRDEFMKLVLADKQAALEILKHANHPPDTQALEKAFDDFAQVAEQGLSVYNKTGVSLVQKWARCFDADNVAIGAGRIVLELDRQMELQGLEFRSGREFFATQGLDLAKLQAGGIDLERNKKGMSKAGRRGKFVGMTAAGAAIGAAGALISAAIVPASWAFSPATGLAAVAINYGISMALVLPVAAVVSTIPIPQDPSLYPEAELAKEPPSKTPPDRFQ